MNHSASNINSPGNTNKSFNCGKQYSIEDLEKNSNRYIRISTPCSVLALKRTGISQEELYFVPFIEFIQKNPEMRKLSPEIQESRYMFFEGHRKEKIQEIKKVRNQIKNDKIGSIYLILGKERYCSEEIKNALLGKLSPQEKEFNSSIYFEGSTINMFTLNGLIKGFISIGFLNLSISYSLRYILIKVFILLSPFAFISLINPSSSWIFKSWIKLFLSLLILQILVPVILLVAFSIDSNSSDMFSKIIYIGSIYSLIKANSFVKDFMGGLSTDISLGISSFKNLITKQ